MSDRLTNWLKLLANVAIVAALVALPVVSAIVPGFMHALLEHKAILIVLVVGLYIGRIAFWWIYSRKQLIDVIDDLDSYDRTKFIAGTVVASAAAIYFASNYRWLGALLGTSIVLYCLMRLVCYWRIAANAERTATSIKQQQ